MPLPRRSLEGMCEIRYNLHRYQSEAAGPYADGDQEDVRSTWVSIPVLVMGSFLLVLV